MQQNLSEELQAVAFINVLQTTMLCLITTQWKISIHGTAISGLAVLTYAIVGSIAILVVLCIPLVGWSRVYMRRHTLLQVLAGAMLGATIVYFTIRFYGL